MEDYFSSYFQKLVKSPAAGSFSSDLNSNNMELLNNYSHHLGNTDHVYGVEDYSTAPDDQFSLTGNGTTTHQQGLFCPFDQGKTPMMQSMPSIVQGAEIRHKNITTSMSEFSEIPTSPGFGSESGGIGNDSSNKHTGASARKRKRKNEGQVEMKPREVVHVRAKRGQATDSHSLAERVRRERINEKLRVLQDLVPGCYKTMGMAVMLDVIINYVRSLQNQIEFLSMKLSAASLFYDFNSPEAEALETLQRTATAFEAHGMNRTAAEGCNTNERMKPRDQ